MIGLLSLISAMVVLYVLDSIILDIPLMGAVLLLARITKAI